MFDQWLPFGMGEHVEAITSDRFQHSVADSPRVEARRDLVNDPV
jgi:hypothetical protein